MDTNIIKAIVRWNFKNKQMLFIYFLSVVILWIPYNYAGLILKVNTIIYLCILLCKNVGAYKKVKDE